MRNWVTNANEKQLLSFVYGVTGLKSLPPGTEMIIYIIKKSREHIPIARTCFFRFKVPSEYDSQEKFDQKMAKFLENINGFTIA